jgi:hypothetical protein
VVQLVEGQQRALLGLLWHALILGLFLSFSQIGLMSRLLGACSEKKTSEGMSQQVLTRSEGMSQQVLTRSEGMSQQVLTSIPERLVPVHVGREIK